MAEYKYWLDGYIKANYDIILKEAIPNNWDALTIIFGKEGSGKTTLGSQLSKYCHENFNLDHTVFTPGQFEEIIDSCEPESSILWDEAITGANVAEYANKVSISIVKKLTQIRKKRLKIFICFPYLDMLNKYFIKRCVCGIYIYAKGFDDRGYGLFYSQPRLESLYYHMKETYRYMPLAAISRAPANFYFSFGKALCLPELEYDIKKDAARESEPDNTNLWRDRIGIILKYLKEKKGINTNEIAKVLGLNAENLYRLM